MIFRASSVPIIHYKIKATQSKAVRTHVQHINFSWTKCTSTQVICPPAAAVLYCRTWRQITFFYNLHTRKLLYIGPAHYLKTENLKSEKKLNIRLFISYCKFKVYTNIVRTRLTLKPKCFAYPNHGKQY
jgi:hypothetical protein